MTKLTEMIDEFMAKLPSGTACVLIAFEEDDVHGYHHEVTPEQIALAGAAMLRDAAAYLQDERKKKLN